MKTKFFILIIFTFMSCKTSKVYAQYDTSHLTPFVGVWENQINNQIFRVTIYIDDSYLKGDYELVQVNSDNSETLLYKSNYNIPGTLVFNGYTIFGGSHDGLIMHGSIEDNSIDYENGLDSRKTKSGSLGLTIIDSCSTCPTTAEWKVSRPYGIRLDTEPLNYNIPTDIILTKTE